MYRTPRPDRITNARRPGFTLVEILVVISIIAVLAALSVGAAFSLIGTQKKNNSRLVIQKTADALDQQWKAVVDQAKNEAVSTGEFSLAGSDARRAKVIHIYLRLRQEFPATYAEAVKDVTDKPLGSPYGILLKAKNGYVNAVGAKAGTASTQSSACLLLALSQPRRGMSFKADQALGSGAVQDTDNDGMNEIIDGWQHPLGFWRWPTQNTELSGTLSSDPLDPEGILVAPSWNNSGNQQAVTTFEYLCGGGYTIHTFVAGVWTPQVAKTRPVVGSTGPDGLWGVNLWGDGVNSPPSPPPDGIGLWGDMAHQGSTQQNSSGDSDNDNLYSYRLSLGGKGD